MDRANEKSLTDLKREAERSRAELAETVDQLRSRVSDTVTDFRERASPDSMKAEISDYFRTRGDALLERARENLLQTAAIGIGVGYPLLKVARSIPAPILMVGAGLYLLGTSSGQKFADTVSKKVSAAADGVSDSFSAGVNVANRKVHDTQDLAASSLAAARDTLASGAERATQQAAAFGSSLNELKESAANLAGSASDGAVGLKQRAVGALGATSDAMSASAARTGSIVRDRASDAAEFGTNAGLKLRDQAVDASLKFRDQAVETSHKVSSGMSDIIQRNPLLFGGLGLTVGMLIASALPKSEIEKNVLGEASADVQKRANTLASKQFDNVKGLASEAIADIADHVSQEGLTPADLNAATEDLGRRVRRVAESASEAAFGRTEDKTRPNQNTVDAI
jgi:gas vesicle protein